MIPTEYNSASLQEVIESLGGKEYEHHLSQLTERDPKDVFSWITARDMSRDPFMKNYYLRQMMECIRGNGDVMSYLKGITYTHNIGRTDLNRELSDEMTEKHPVMGQFFKVMFHLPPNVFFYNPFD